MNVESSIIHTVHSFEAAFCSFGSGSSNSGEAAFSSLFCQGGSHRRWRHSCEHTYTIWSCNAHSSLPGTCWALAPFSTPRRVCTCRERASWPAGCAPRSGAASRTACSTPTTGGDGGGGGGGGSGSVGVAVRFAQGLSGCRVEMVEVAVAVVLVSQFVSPKICWICRCYRPPAQAQTIAKRTNGRQREGEPTRGGRQRRNKISRFAQDDPSGSLTRSERGMREVSTRAYIAFTVS